MDNKQLVKCKFCGDSFEYNPSNPQKKFCSWLGEKKECYKKYHYKEWYARRKKEREAGQEAEVLHSIAQQILSPNIR